MKLNFTIRDLFWLMLVAGLALGWWLDHQRCREAYLQLQLNWLQSIPPPYPKKEVEIELLESENAQLRELVERLEQKIPQSLPEQTVEEPPCPDLPSSK